MNPVPLQQHHYVALFPRYHHFYSICNCFDKSFSIDVTFSTIATYDNYIHITQPNAKSMPNCDVCKELHQACGHVMLLNT